LFKYLFIDYEALTYAFGLGCEYDKVKNKKMRVEGTHTPILSKKAYWSFL
jgi:hypothetical protein